MLNITKHTEQRVLICDSTSEFLSINEHELIEAQILIAEGSLEGYYILYGEHKVTIDTDGNISDWSNLPFNTSQILYSKLFNIRKNKLK